MQHEFWNCTSSKSGINYRLHNKHGHCLGTTTTLPVNKCSLITTERIAPLSKLAKILFCKCMNQIISPLHYESLSEYTPVEKNYITWLKIKKFMKHKKKQKKKKMDSVQSCLQMTYNCQFQQNIMKVHGIFHLVMIYT